MLSSLVYLIISAFALGKLFGAYGVLASNIVCAILTLLTVWLYYAVKNKKLLPAPENYLNLLDDLHIGPGDIISLDIRDKKDISLVAEQIQMFCRGHKVDKKTGVKAAVCFEELAVNIISFGFPKCKKKLGIDLRLVYSKNEIIMRLRDNCPLFDVERHIAEDITASGEEPELRLGLKLIGGLSENIKYVNSLETNNVILKFALTE